MPDPTRSDPGPAGSSPPEVTTVPYGRLLAYRTVMLVPVSFSAVTRSRRQAGPRRRRVSLHRHDLQRLLWPYVSTRAQDQLRAVVPLALYLSLFQMLILRQHVADPGTVLFGLLAVVVGLMLFMEGLRVGLMPFGETIGHALPTRSPLPVVLVVAFLLGVGVTYAEPAIGALRQAGQLVRVEDAPFLWGLLNVWAEILVLAVGIGVGLAALVGMLRFIQGWSLKPLIYVSVALCLALTVVAAVIPDLAPVVSLAWDCGAVTTGPVTVPLVLALGIGVASSAGSGDSSLSGFGIVTLASLFPVIAVLLVALVLYLQVPPEQIVEAARLLAEGAAEPHWTATSPWAEMIGGVRAIVPLVVFLLLVARFVARADIEEKRLVALGLGLALLGMVVFNVGLTYGLAKLGAQSGTLVPAAFAETERIADSPLYNYVVGLAVAFLFAWVLGFGATLAEPALHALGQTVQTLTNGAFRKQTLMLAVSLGVASGIALGVAKLVFDWPLVAMVLPGYVLALALTAVSTEEFVNVAWDSAGVTTGPVTVPLVLAMGLGFGETVGAIEGFGILAMASIGPIVSVLATGLVVQARIRAAEAAPPPEPEEAAA